MSHPEQEMVDGSPPFRTRPGETLHHSSRAGDAPLGLYISVPFCRSKCTYCNFASGVYPASEHERYVLRLIEDLADAGEWAGRIGVELPRRLDTIYLGGGTPSLLGPALVARLFQAVRRHFEIDPCAEITVECAPGQIADETLAALASAGVNRVSLGVQSFVDREAALSGRLHSRSIVLEDLRRLREAGIANINVDLIAGLAGQTLASWHESIKALVDCAVTHASVYMLEVDEDSRLGREMLSGGARYHAGLVPSDDAIAAMYSEAIETLAAAGLDQYEISNFSRDGLHSRHNMRYWQRRPYLGVGLDASSMLRQSPSLGFASCDPAAARVLRSTTASELKEYLHGATDLEMDWIPPQRQHEEAWFLGLRLNAGVNQAALEREFGMDLVAPALAAVERLHAHGLLALQGQTIRLTPRGRMLANEVFQEFVGLRAECPA
jgi:oxygen-independent coproporphyrinogen III oxidase